MDIIQEKLFLYCRSTDLNECIITLKDKLKKNSQVEEYDLIYNNFVDTSSLEEYSQTSDIQDLNRPIHLMIFCQIYRHLLFPEHFHEVAYVSDERMEWVLSLFDRVYSPISFTFIAYQLVNFYGKSFRDDEDYLKLKKKLYYYSIENRQILIDLTIENSPYISFIDYVLPKNRFCFPYILLHNASKLSFESMATLLVYDERITKIPIGFRFFIDINTEGPHGNFFDIPQSFFDHDLSHFYNTLHSICKYNVSNIWKEMKVIRIGTAFRKLVDVYIHIFIFDTSDVINESYQRVEVGDISENRHRHVCVPLNFNIFDNFKDNILTIPNNLDENDHGYLFKYLMSANDINDNELIERYFEYQLQYNELKETLLSIRKDLSKLDFEFEKYENEEPPEELQEYVGRLGEHELNVTSNMKRLSKEFLQLYMTKLI